MYTNFGMMHSIIGGGIGGLCTALAFEKLGIEYQLFERAPEIKEVGAGIWLAPNALQVLEWLGILDEVKEKGNSIDQITLARKDLSPLSDMSQEVFKAHYGFSTIAIHRASLQRILFDRVPNDKIHLGKSFDHYVLLESGGIEIGFSDDTTVQSTYLIGADGIHSKVRQQLFPDSEIRYSGQTCWRGIADFDLALDFEHRGIELWGDQIRFGISKISSGKVYWFAVAKRAPEGADARGKIRQTLLDMYSSFHPVVEIIIKATASKNIFRNDISDLKSMDKWYNHNVCLIGDAAHATTPNMGQGGAQAIEDAYFLSNSIKDNGGGETSFARFQKRRQKKVREIVNQSWTTGQMAHWKYGQRIRNIVMSIIPSSLIRKKLMQMYKLES